MKTAEVNFATSHLRRTFEFSIFDFFGTESSWGRRPAVI